MLVLSLLALCLYYGLYPLRVARRCRPRVNAEATPANEKTEAAPTHTGQKPLPPVSVVMATHNEVNGLRENLLYLLEQDYPNFEIVVVDYMSTDDTPAVLQLLAHSYGRLKVVTLRTNANNYQGMKYPLSIGIRSAQHDLLLLTTPDCRPSDTTDFQWMRRMVEGYTSDKTDIVLGYCSIGGKGSLLNALQQYDNLDYSAQYLGAALLRHPFTGNGRNLSYRRSLFMQHDGFIYHYHIPYGADDLFVNRNANRRNTAVALAPDAFTTALPYPTFHAWRLNRHQRQDTLRRHKLWQRLARAMRPCAVLLFYTAWGLLLGFHLQFWPILAAIMVLKLAWQEVSYAKATQKLDAKPVVYILSPLFEIYFLIANTILALFPLKTAN